MMLYSPLFVLSVSYFLRFLSTLCLAHFVSLYPQFRLKKLAGHEL